MNVGFISLGCSKNLVDTEMMIGLFKNKRYNIVVDPKDADIIIINTCGFIESAKTEAIDTILEMSEYKKKKCKYLIVTGCLVERYKDELIKEIPEVDLFIKFSEYETFWKQIEDAIKEIKVNKNEKEKDYKLDFLDREVSTGANYAYLRIADGCDNFCTFCSIPYIRGRFKSRPIEDIENEVKLLAKKGIKELVVIAQDTTKYGIDLYKKERLAELLERISKVNGIKWIRFLYAYPETLTDEILDVVKNNKKVIPYFDIPIQHISNNMLKSMNRKTTKESIEKLIKKIRKDLPDACIRSTVMCGFPGETEEDFNELYEFLKEAKFDRLGCFTYSKEDGTPAEKMKNQVDEKIKKDRYNKIMSLQQKISEESLKSRIGKEYDVLIEETNVIVKGEKYSIGRTQFEAPEIDGVVFVKGTLDKNTFAKAKIVKTAEYDMFAEIV